MRYQHNNILSYDLKTKLKRRKVSECLRPSRDCWGASGGESENNDDDDFSQHQPPMSAPPGRVSSGLARGQVVRRGGSLTPTPPPSPGRRSHKGPAPPTNAKERGENQQAPEFQKGPSQTRRILPPAAQIEEERHFWDVSLS